MGHCEPPRRACGAAWHLRPVSAPADESNSSRCRFRLQVSRFFAATASAPHSSDAARESRPRTALVGWLTPCASWLREPHRTARLLAPSVVGWRSRGGSKTRRAHAPSARLSAKRRLPPHQDPNRRRRVRTPSLRCPGHLPSDRDMTLRPREIRSRSLKWSRASSRTLSLDAIQPALSGLGPSVRATPRSLGSPCGSPRVRGEDASHRLLQPTSRHEHPRNVRLPGPQQAAATASSRATGPRSSGTRLARRRTTLRQSDPR